MVRIVGVAVLAAIGGDSVGEVGDFIPLIARRPERTQIDFGACAGEVQAREPNQAQTRVDDCNVP
jgi:hypothetical protein